MAAPGLPGKICEEKLDILTRLRVTEGPFAPVRTPRIIRDPPLIHVTCPTLLPLLLKILGVAGAHILMCLALRLFSVLCRCERQDPTIGYQYHETLSAQLNQGMLE